jgi:predicted nucleic acid-binding protein
LRVARVGVINASPLILLSRGGHLRLLTAFAEEIVVPGPVATEILQRGPSDVTAKALEETSWLRRAPAPVVPERVLAWGLGPGESSVLAYVLANPGVEAVIDDLAGRKCATALGIPVRGTLGCVLAAKQRGVIPAARPVIEDLLRGGLYLSRDVIDEALKRVGE